MSFGVALHNGYEYTCEVCTVVRAMFIATMISIIAFTESAGRAKAASELARMGYHKEAKELMVGRDD